MSDYRHEMRAHRLEPAHYAELTDMMLAALQAQYPGENAEQWRGVCADAIIADCDAGVPWIVIFDGTGAMTAAFSIHSNGAPSRFIVTPDRWGSGLAVKILTMARAAANDGLTFAIAGDNKRAQHFFRRMGLTQSGEAVCAVTGKHVTLWRDGQ